MCVRQGILRAALLACLLVCACPAGALANKHEESILMDDDQLIYATPAHMARTLREIKALGVDRVKVTVVWSLVAPRASARRKPKFDAANPASYPYGAWKRWDQLVAWCRLLGLKVYFQVGAPAPVWATSGPHEAQGDGYRWSERPNAREFGQFVKAVGRRYSGNYIPANENALRPPRQLGAHGQSGITPTASDPNPPVQRVNYWGLWNEPNVTGWMSPQFRRVGGHEVDNSPRMYRRLVDTSYAALKASGHASDTILIGELASHGAVYPIPFTQELYCVSGSYRPLTGSRATALGCPSSGDRARFAAAHPGLFAFPGFAYHPYSFDTPPNRTMADPNIITLANLVRIEAAVDRSRGAYGKRPRHGTLMYLTEWGYKTNPPNPFVKSSLTDQATWLNQGEYDTYHMPRVTSLAQFLLVDNGPQTSNPKGTRGYWSTFQTGLIFANGRAKPALGAFRLPIWVPNARHGSAVAVWGEIRPAVTGQTRRADLQFRASHSGRWRRLKRVKTTSSEGFLSTRVRIPGAGELRLTWHNPRNGKTFTSRVVTIS